MNTTIERASNLKGLTLTELANTLTAQRNAKRDVIVNTHALTFNPNATTGSLSFEMNGEGRIEVPMSNHALRDISEAYSIPMPYIDRLRYGVKDGKSGKLIVDPQPELLAENINSWFRKQPLGRLMRMFRGLGPTDVVRAILSDKFRTIDHYDIADSLLPVLIEAGAEILSCQVTETKLYIKAVFPKITGELKVGDTVQAGIIISNSETGDGRFLVEPFMYRLVCLNGMVVGMALRRTHVGRSNGNGGGDAFDGATEYFTDETREADDKALMLKARDTVKALADQARFDLVVAKFSDTMNVTVGTDVAKIADTVSKRFLFSETEKTSFLGNLVAEQRTSTALAGTITAFDAINAVTAMAKTASDYDRAVEFERLGGVIMEAPKSAFDTLKPSDIIGR